MSGQRSRTSDFSDWWADGQHWSVDITPVPHLNQQHLFCHFEAVTESLSNTRKTWKTNACMREACQSTWVQTWCNGNGSCCALQQMSNLSGCSTSCWRESLEKGARRKPVYKVKVTCKPWTLLHGWIEPLWPSITSIHIRNCHLCVFSCACAHLHTCICLCYRPGTE